MSARRSVPRGRTATWAVAFLSLAGCNALLGIDDATTGTPSDGASGGRAAGVGGQGLGGRGAAAGGSGQAGGTGAGGQAGGGPPPTVVAIAAGGRSTCALLDDGALRCWGDNLYGQLGLAHTGTIGNNELPAAASPDVGEKAAQVVVGDDHACALLAGGDLRCWGNKANGQLGLGHLNYNLGDDEAPAQGARLGFGSRLRQISAGGNHTCALLESGDLRCWGDNASGQLGYGSATPIGDDELITGVPPVNVGGKVVHAATGSSHTCALLETGAVRCWGANGSGQLGLGRTDSVGDAAGETPTSVGAVSLGGKATQLTAGGNHTCALLEGGAVRCWGANGSGQLGYGNTANVGDLEGQTPAAFGPVDLGGKATQLTAGGNHTCALLEGGAVRCWGANGSGQLGYGNTANVGDTETPTQVAAVGIGGPVRQIAAGSNHTCALLEGGSVRCWGNNEYGQLGLGNVDHLGDNELLGSAPPVDVVGAGGAGGQGGAASCEAPTQFAKVIDCSQPGQCEGTIRCDDVASCDVQCTDDQSCNRAQIQCPLHGDCRVTCSGKDSCRDAGVLCGAGACTIVCANEGLLGNGRACQGMKDLDCSGVSGPCTVAYTGSLNDLPAVLGCEPPSRACACGQITSP